MSVEKALVCIHTCMSLSSTVLQHNRTTKSVIAVAWTVLFSCNPTGMFCTCVCVCVCVRMWVCACMCVCVYKCVYMTKCVWMFVHPWERKGGRDDMIASRTYFQPHSQVRTRLGVCVHKPRLMNSPNSISLFPEVAVATWPLNVTCQHGRLDCLVE